MTHTPGTNGAVEPSAPARRTRLEILAWLAGALLFGGVAISAVNRVADRLGIVTQALDERQTLAGLVAVTLFLLIAVCWLIGMGFVGARLGGRAAFGIGMAGVLAARVAVALAVDAPLVSDWLAYHEQAVDVAAEGPRLGDRPIGYPVLLGALYAAFGPDVWLAEALNVVMALVSAAVIFDLLRRSAGPMAAAVGIGLVAIMPSLALMTPVVSTEATYTTLLLVAIWCLAVYARQPPRVLGRSVPPAVWISGSAALAGAVLGLSQYVRPSSLVLLPAFGILALVAARGARPRIAGASLVIAFLAVLAPVIVDNLIRYGEPSVETSSYAGWGIYVGTNQEADGRFNEADAEVLRTLPGDSLRERSNAAGRLGIARIVDDPTGFGALAVRKLVGMWGEDGYAVFFALEWERDPPLAPGLLLAGYTASAISWGFVTVAAAWLVLRFRGRIPPWLLATVLVAGSLTLLHAVVEVQPRYHAAMTPLWIAAAAVALAGRSATAVAAPPPAPR